MRPPPTKIRNVKNTCYAVMNFSFRDWIAGIVGDFACYFGWDFIGPSSCLWNRDFKRGSTIFLDQDVFALGCCKVFLFQVRCNLVSAEQPSGREFKLKGRDPVTI